MKTWRWIKFISSGLFDCSDLELCDVCSVYSVYYHHLIIFGRTKWWDAIGWVGMGWDKKTSGLCRWLVALCNERAPMRADKCNITFSYPVENRQCMQKWQIRIRMLRTQKGGNAELDDGCSGSRFDELRLLQVQTVYAPQTEQLAMRRKCIKDHTCIHMYPSYRGKVEHHWHISSCLICVKGWVADLQSSKWPKQWLWSRWEVASVSLSGACPLPHCAHYLTSPATVSSGQLLPYITSVDFDITKVATCYFIVAAHPMHPLMVHDTRPPTRKTEAQTKDLDLLTQRSKNKDASRRQQSSCFDTTAALDSWFTWVGSTHIVMHDFIKSSWVLTDQRNTILKMAQRGTCKVGLVENGQERLKGLQKMSNGHFP